MQENTQKIEMVEARLTVRWSSSVWLALLGLLGALANSCVQRREVPHIGVVEREQAPHERVHPVAALSVARPPGVELDH